MNDVELRGTKAGSRIQKGKLKLFTEMEGELTDVVPVLKEQEDPHGEHLRHFIDVIKGRAKPVLTPEHGVDMIKILFAIYRSAEAGKEVSM